MQEQQQQRGNGLPTPQPTFREECALEQIRIDCATTAAALDMRLAIQSKLQAALRDAHAAERSHRQALQSIAEICTAIGYDPDADRDDDEVNF